jgi:hypothetical protein
VELLFDVKRGDESDEIGMITDHLIAEILGSDLIVADLSFLNPERLLRVGHRTFLGKTSHSHSHLETTLPFDNIGCRVVMFDPTDWHSQVEARKQIADFARNALAQGAAISNPVTHARGWKKLKASADPQEAIVANLVEGMARLQEGMAILIRTRTHHDLFASPITSGISTVGSSTLMSTLAEARSRRKAVL